MKSGISGPVVSKSKLRVINGTVSKFGCGVVKGNNISSVVTTDGSEGIGIVWKISAPIEVKSNKPKVSGVVGKSKFISGFGVLIINHMCVTKLTLP